MCCSSGNEGGCETNSVGYRIVCQGCLLAGKQTEYKGESARNAFSRGLEHLEGLRNEREDSATLEALAMARSKFSQWKWLEAFICALKGKLMKQEESHPARQTLC